MIEEKTVVGIYSDSGLNGIELSLIKTDGIDLYGEQKHLIRPYPADLRKRIFEFILKETAKNGFNLRNSGIIWNDSAKKLQ